MITVRYEWFEAMETSYCASATEGWQPLHIAIYRQNKLNDEGEHDRELVAALPLYAKYHSQGEFIFDFQWAQFAESVLGIRYYPKLLAAVPMTPATGPRVLTSNSLDSSGMQAIIC